MTSDEPPFKSSHYRRCEDPGCPVAYAYEAEQGQPHWHFTGSEHHPAEMPDDADLR